MVLVSVRYTFNQKFPVPARDAFRWAVNYQPGDFELMGLDGEREIVKISDDSFILKETIRHGKAKTRSKLIRIDHDRMLYTNTHITGPAKHSQFIYEIVPEGKTRSKLRFTGLLLYRSEEGLSKKEVARVASEERKFDSDIWKRLAKAMQADLKSS
jgi:hypothetical protein